MAATVGSWTPDKKHSDYERWICIYPAYINSKKTRAGGRRLPKDRCVDNPTHQEIRDVLVAAGFKIGVENKQYPKEKSKEMIYRGRIRVHLKNDDGTPVNPEYPTREAIVKYIADAIPRLKTRQPKPAEPAQASTKGGKSKKKKR